MKSSWERVHPRGTGKCWKNHGNVFSKDHPDCVFIDRVADTARYVELKAYRKDETFRRGARGVFNPFPPTLTGGQLNRLREIGTQTHVAGLILVEYVPSFDPTDPPHIRYGHTLHLMHVNANSLTGGVSLLVDERALTSFFPVFSTQHLEVVWTVENHTLEARELDNAMQWWFSRAWWEPNGFQDAPHFRCLPYRG